MCVARHHKNLVVQHPIPQKRNKNIGSHWTLAKCVDFCWSRFNFANMFHCSHAPLHPTSWNDSNYSKNYLTSNLWVIEKDWSRISTHEIGKNPTLEFWIHSQFFEKVEILCPWFYWHLCHLTVTWLPWNLLCWHRRGISCCPIIKMSVLHAGSCGTHKIQTQLTSFDFPSVKRAKQLINPQMICSPLGSLAIKKRDPFNNFWESTI